MFPNVKNKKFQDLSNGGLIKVIDQFEDVAVLDNKQRINVKRLLDGSLYEEFIDPNSFFGANSLQSLAEKIKSIPNEVLTKINDEKEESLIIPYDPEEEKRMLLEKTKSMNPVNSVMNQMEKFKNLIDDDESILYQSNTVQTRIAEEPYSDSAQISQTLPPVVQNQPNVQSQNLNLIQSDPMTSIFKNVKRKNDFKYTIEIEGKIPRPDFIEMMEDSYEMSLIDYLSQEFTNELLSDPEKIKKSIKKEIERIVYGENKESSVEKIEEEQIKVQKKPTRNKNKKQNDTPITN
jgi:hypothetical protein